MGTGVYALGPLGAIGRGAARGTGRDAGRRRAGDGTGRSAARDADLSPVTTQTYELRYSRNPILMSLAVLDYA